MLDHHDAARPISYFFVGVGKCGTSWLHTHLGRSGLVDVGKVKEPYLLDKDVTEQARHLERWWPTRGLPRADFSNLYYFDPANPRKITEHNPQARVILTVRTPSARAVSHFRFLLRNGLVNGSMAEYLASGDGHDLVKRSDYAPMVERYVDAVGPDHFLVLPLELLQRDAQAYSDALGRFLGHDFGTLTEDDRKPVLGAATARNARVAAAAWHAGNLMRRLGLLRALSVVKNAPFLQRALYTTAAKDDEFASSARNHPELRRLDETYPQLLAQPFAAAGGSS